MTMVTTVRLPMKLHEWAKKRAQIHGQTISGLVRVTLESLKHDEDKANKSDKIKALEQ